VQPLPEYTEALQALRKCLAPFLKSQPKTGPHAEALKELDKETALFDQDVEQFRKSAQQAARQCGASQTHRKVRANQRGQP